MFETLNWLPIHKRLKYYKAGFTYKVLNNLSPQYITDLLKPVSKTHNGTLRSSVNGALTVPRSRSSLFDRSYSFILFFTVKTNMYQNLIKLVFSLI